MRNYIFLLFLTLTLTSLKAADTLTIVSEGDNYIFGNYCQMLTDEAEVYNFNSVKKTRGWKELKDIQRLNLPETNTIYWIRFCIKNMDSTHLRWMLEFPDGHNSFLQLQEITSNGDTITYNPVGLGQTIKNRAYDHKNFLFDLNIPFGKTNIYYVKVKSKYYSSFWASARNSKYLFSYITREYYYIGLFYGILFIMAMYNLLIFAFTKEKVYLLYVLYVISCGFYTFSEDLIGFQLFWPNTTFFNHFQFENAPSLLICAFTFYSIEFLELRKHYKKFVFFLYAMIALNIITSAIIPSLVPVQIKVLFFLSPFAVIYYHALRLYFSKKYKPARFFLLGFSVILGGFLVFVLRTYGILPSTLYTIYIFNFGFVLEVMIFSFALGDKIKIIKEEKEKNQQKIIEVLEEKEILKDKINKELELKVKERTSELINKSEELELANSKLRYLTDELNKMNSQLDIDNWNLKKQVKNETKSRILIEKVSYEEFLSIFPNDSVCLQYLENLKWENGYHCKKCQYTSFSVGEKPFSRKCNKCKYTESATAGTLFHSIKFPLNKAFYITHDTFKESTFYTVEQLSDAISLRKATVWTFRKKVQEAKAEKLKKRKSLDSWDDIILD